MDKKIDKKQLERLGKALNKISLEMIDEQSKFIVEDEVAFQYAEERRKKDKIDKSSK